MSNFRFLKTFNIKLGVLYLYIKKYGIMKNQKESSTKSRDENSKDITI